MKAAIYPVIMILFLLLLPHVEASSQNSNVLSDHEVIITEDDNPKGSLMIFAGNAVIKGKLDGDTSIFAGNVTFPGISTGFLTVMGGNVDFTGTCGESVFVGSNVVLNGTCTGPIEVGGSNVVLRGVFEDEVRVDCGKVEVNGTFKKALALSCEKARLGPDTVIEGDLEYFVREELKDTEGAVVKGEKRDVSEQRRKEAARKLRETLAITRVVFFICLAVSGVLFHLLFPAQFRKVHRVLWNNPGLSIFYGLVGIFGGVVIVVVLLFTVIGIPSGLVLGFGYLASFYLALLFPATTIGVGILNSFKDCEDKPLWGGMFLGLLLALVASFIPVLGGIVLFVLILAGFGGIVHSVFHRESPPLGYIPAPIDVNPEMNSAGQDSGDYT